MRDFSFGDYLASLRKESNLSQEELARLLGISNKAVSKWETGASKPTTDKIIKLSKIFGCSVET